MDLHYVARRGAVRRNAVPHETRFHADGRGGGGSDAVAVAARSPDPLVSRQVSTWRGLTKWSAAIESMSRTRCKAIATVFGVRTGLVDQLPTNSLRMPYRRA